MISDLGCTGPAQHSSKPAYVVFITRVFYARTFDYQFSQSDATAASLRVALAAATATAAQTATPAGTAAPTASANAARAAADAAANSVKSLTSSSTPGGAASLEIGSQGGLALKQSFDRPLAFGVGQPIVFDADETLATIESN